MTCSDRKSRGELLSTAEVQWSTTKSDGMWSIKAGLRAKAMASLPWAMVTDATGQVAEVLHGPNRARKGKTGSRRDSGRAGDCAGGGGGDCCGGVHPGAA